MTFKHLRLPTGKRQINNFAFAAIVATSYSPLWFNHCNNGTNSGYLTQESNEKNVLENKNDMKLCERNFIMKFRKIPSSPLRPSAKTQCMVKCMETERRILILKLWGEEILGSNSKIPHQIFEYVYGLLIRNPWNTDGITFFSQRKFLEISFREHYYTSLVLIYALCSRKSGKEFHQNDIAGPRNASVWTSGAKRYTRAKKSNFRAGKLLA